MRCLKGASGHRFKQCFSIWRRKTLSKNWLCGVDVRCGFAVWMNTNQKLCGVSFNGWMIVFPPCITSSKFGTCYRNWHIRKEWVSCKRLCVYFAYHSNKKGIRIFLGSNWQICCRWFYEINRWKCSNKVIGCGCIWCRWQVIILNNVSNYL